MTPAFLLTLLTIVAAVLGVAGVCSILLDLFHRDRTRITQRFDEEFQRRQHIRKTVFKDVGQMPAMEAAADGESPSLRRRFEMIIQQSGMNITASRLLTIAAISGLVIGGIGFLVRDIIVALIVGLAAASTPILYVRYRQRSRMDTMLAQLPDVLDLMARIVRAGQTMSQALQAVGDEFEPPISIEFAYCYEQQNLGLPADVALRELAERSGLIEIRILVLAMLVQQQTGGNLAVLLEKLARVVRERLRIRGVIRTLTAEGRLQAVVLLALPPVLFIVMMVMNRAYTEVLLEHPNVLVAMLAAMGVGAAWIRKIINFDF